ncbi:MAG: polyamine aminopropyltransferase, partial [Planctomycetaceae bacterium]
ALVASLMFPIFLVPYLGLIRTSLLFGMLNAGVGLWGSYLLRPLLKSNPAGLRGRAVLTIALLAIGFVKAETLTKLSEEDLYEQSIVYAKTTRYQRIVVTRGVGGFKLFLNGHLQFYSADEYRYHEALVHPAMLLSGKPRRILVLGGGDGLATREILKHGSVESVTLVDLDPGMTQLSQRYPPLGELNRHAFEDRRVTVVNRDALIWLEEYDGDPFDAVVIDFPDPNSFALGKLYTRRFYRLLRRRLTPTAAIGIQCTSPLIARQSYWCILRTMESAGFAVKPYRVSLASFGVWGFALARREPFPAVPALPDALQKNLRFLNDPVLAGLFNIARDIGPVDVEVNRLNNQALVRYYDREWKRWR